MEEISEKDLKFIREIASYGHRYEEEFFSKEAIKREFLKENGINFSKLQTDWWEGLKFFFSHAFYQGRSDEISERVDNNARLVLAQYFKDASSRDLEFKKLQQVDWKPLKKELGKSIGKGKVGRSRDIQLVISTLKFLSNIADKNIARYSLRMIKNDAIEELWINLQKSENDQGGIFCVGPKIASFFIRDIVFYYDLKDEITDNSQEFLQPIDTWVRQIAQELGIQENNETEIRRKIIEKCRLAGVYPIMFNAGAWYTGANSLELLLEKLRN